jgi:hypothetical protein
MMSGSKSIFFLSVAAVILWGSSAWSADPVTIKGMVTNDFQIVDISGKSYDVAESFTADDMLSKATGKKVEVVGMLEESAGIRTITVEAYKVVDK